MARRYSSSSTSGKIARDALKGPHYGARRARKQIPVFALDERVRVVRTGYVGEIVDIASWGDYSVEGVPGWYPGSALERETSD